MGPARKEKPRISTFVPPKRTFTTLSNHAQSAVKKVLTLAPRVAEWIKPGFVSSIVYSGELGDSGPDAAAHAQQCPSGLRVKQKARRWESSDKPLLSFIKHRERYLDSVLRLEGRGSLWGDGSCRICGVNAAEYRCRDCDTYRGVCAGCFTSGHRYSPLHVPERWNGRFFEIVSLKSMGLRFQLGHGICELCPHPSPRQTDFVVVADNGIHSICLDWCGCPGTKDRFEQLLDMGWWPATQADPDTAFTMRGLRSFHVLNLQGRVPPTDYYRSLERLSNGHGLSRPPQRLSTFMLALREWRHIKMCKRAGRGHSLSGIGGTEAGGLSVQCRACPLPGVNLPDGWESAPEELKYLYALHLGQDANFKQKARLRSTDPTRDPALGPGWATFVANDNYLRHLSECVDEDEISHCVGFAALWKANSKRVKGLRATGVGAVSCTRHELLRPNGMGDLQVGERYKNMDYIFLMAIVGFAYQLVFMSYDIACQWSINLVHRVAKYPQQLQLPHGTRFNFLVPKFHLPAHTAKCFGPYSFNFCPGAGRDDGEGVERIWSWLNGIARCTSMMGAGGRWDTLDDFCNFHNWRKTLSLGSELHRRLALAIPESIVHRRAYHAFTESLQVGHAKQLGGWVKMVDEWEADKLKPCPYDLPRKEISFADVRRDLSVEDHNKLEQGDTTLSLSETTPSSFVVTGLNLEERQQSIMVDVASATTSTQIAALTRRRTVLLKDIQKFHQIQTSYMPGLRRFQRENSTPPADFSSQPELLPLNLPSSIPSNSREDICTAGVDSIETRLREAQCSESLADLRTQLIKRTYTNKYKERTASSQRAYTRFRTLQNQTEVKIKSAQTVYNTARSALLALKGPGSWEDQYQVLKREDVRGMHERGMTAEEKEDHIRTRRMAGFSNEQIEGELDGAVNMPTIQFDPVLALGEGRRQLSWIWYTISDRERQIGDVDGYLRVEWLKCRARAQRWAEEVALLEEEMRRCVSFCHWKAHWWSQRSERLSTADPSLTEGLVAYAAEQITFEQRRASMWEQKWFSIRSRAHLIRQTGFGDEGSSFSPPELEVDLDEEEEEEEWDPIEEEDEDEM